MKLTGPTPKVYATEYWTGKDGNRKRPGDPYVCECDVTEFRGYVEKQLRATGVVYEKPLLIIHREVEQP